MNASPVTVLMSWCKLTTWTPVISWTNACMSGFAVSIRWVRTCLSKSLPFSDGKLASCCSAGVNKPLQPDDEEIAEQVGVNILGATASVLLFKATDPLADGGLDFSLGFHFAGNSGTAARICSTFPK